MSITQINTEQLRRMNNSEGLVIQGCVGDLQEWVDGINEMLTEAEILRNGSRFEKAYTFKNEGLTCLMFPFEDMELDVGKLAMWRLQTHEMFSGTWLTDYVDNKLNGFIQEPSKPKCAIIGKNGNIFNIMAAASNTLKRSNMAAESEEMCSRVMSSGSYEEALGIVMEYVEPCSEKEMNEESEEIDMCMG